jgi:hypothetical protein
MDCIGQRETLLIVALIMMNMIHFIDRRFLLSRNNKPPAPPNVGGWEDRT